MAKFVKSSKDEFGLEDCVHNWFWLLPSNFLLRRPVNIEDAKSRYLIRVSIECIGQCGALARIFAIGVAECVRFEEQAHTHTCGGSHRRSDKMKTSFPPGMCAPVCVMLLHAPLCVCVCVCASISIRLSSSLLTFVMYCSDRSHVLPVSLAKVRLPIVCLRTRTRFPPRTMLLSWIICTAHNQNDYNFYDVFACGRTSAIVKSPPNCIFFFIRTDTEIHQP